MTRFTRCAVGVEGDWEQRPPCGSMLIGSSTASPFPAVPLHFSRRRILRVLLIVSLAVIGASLAAQLLLGTGAQLFGAARSVWLGICTMWLIALLTLRSRCDVARTTARTVSLVCALCAYWDYLTGWHRWSLSFAIPITIASAIVALVIIVRAMRLEPGEHILSSAVTIVLGLIPLALLMLGQVPVALPSALCGVIAVTSLVQLQQVSGKDLRQELSRRLHL